MADRPAARTVFESLAWLHAPADDPDSCALVEARDDWRLDAARFDGCESAVWGRMPVLRRSGRATMSVALGRERSLLALRRAAPAGLRTWGVERIPPIGRRPRWQAAARSLLMSGAVVRLGRGPGRARVADTIAEQAGAPVGTVHLRVSGDGSALSRVTVREPGDAVLRLATVGGLKDARRNAEALERLAPTGLPSVPRLIGSGELLGVGWSTETVLGGAPVRRLSPALIGDLVGWSAALPSAASPLPAVEERFAVLAAAFPRWGASLGAALERATLLGRELPGVVEHGDLWAGNLLVDGGRLRGVVDWDNWHPAGTPGADLLHLFAMDRRSRIRRELGELWLDRPWASTAFRDATGSYWARLGIPFTEEVGWLAAIGWWAAQVTAALRRGRRPADDTRWVARNVDNVAAALDRERA
jgi:Phosphotransferase enzyme family